MKGQSSQDYAPLLQSENAATDEPQTPHPQNTCNNGRNVKILAVSLGLSILVNLFLIFKPGTVCRDPSLQVYTPAASAVQWEVKKFHREFGHDIPIYEQAPSPEVDAAWKGLYDNYIPSRLYRHELALSPNITQRIWRGEGYIVALDVFHQLHCLDQLRQLLHPQDYPNATVPIGHIRHCIGVIRQNIQCAADISMDVWQWSDKVQRIASRVDVLHTCRNFEKIQAWAAERFVPESEWAEEDFQLHVIDEDAAPAGGYHGHDH